MRTDQQRAIVDWMEGNYKAERMEELRRQYAEDPRSVPVDEYGRPTYDENRDGKWSVEIWRLKKTGRNGLMNPEMVTPGVA